MDVTLMKVIHDAYENGHEYGVAKLFCDIVKLAPVATLKQDPMHAFEMCAIEMEKNKIEQNKIVSPDTFIEETLRNDDGGKVKWRVEMDIAHPFQSLVRNTFTHGLMINTIKTSDDVRKILTTIMMEAAHSHFSIPDAAYLLCMLYGAAEEKGYCLRYIVHEPLDMIVHRIATDTSNPSSVVHYSDVVRKYIVVNDKENTESRNKCLSAFCRSLKNAGVLSDFSGKLKRYVQAIDIIPKDMKEACYSTQTLHVKLSEYMVSASTGTWDTDALAYELCVLEYWALRNNLYITYVYTGTLTEAVEHFNYNSKREASISNYFIVQDINEEVKTWQKETKIIPY